MRANTKTGRLLFQAEIAATSYSQPMFSIGLIVTIPAFCVKISLNLLIYNDLTRNVNMTYLPFLTLLHHIRHVSHNLTIQSMQFTTILESGIIPHPERFASKKRYQFW